MAFGDAGLGGAETRLLDRAVVIVEPDEGRVGKRLRHQDRRRTVPTANVRDLGAAFEFLAHAVERRDPLGDEMGLVAGAEEPFGAAEEAVVVLVPPHPFARPERLGDLLPVGVERLDQLERTQHVDRALLVGERHRVLVRERVPVRLRVVGQVAACGLIA